MQLKLLGIVALVLLAFGLRMPTIVYAAESEESQLKAVFVLNFAKLTEWPDDIYSSGGAFTVTILGKAPSVLFKKKLERQTLRGAHITVKYVDTVQQAKGSQLLYVSNSESRRLPEILSELQQLPILTVSDIPGFSPAGGMIGLLPVQNRLGFEVNAGALRKARLSVSSQVLKLAKEIYGQ